MKTKGTITWYPIENAPKDGTIILVKVKPEYQNANIGDYVISEWVSDWDKYSVTGKDYGISKHRFSHFAYINPPEERDL